MVNLTQYNKELISIIHHFTRRYYKEMYDEEYTDTDFLHDRDLIMDYKWVLLWPVVISDNYFSIEDILIATEYNIPCKVLQEWYDLYIETDGNPWMNLYNYYVKNKSQ